MAFPTFMVASKIPGLMGFVIREKERMVMGSGAGRAGHYYPYQSYNPLLSANFF
jgi:hypothetical protein